jgi:hypothetical protein
MVVLLQLNIPRAVRSSWANKRHGILLGLLSCLMVQSYCATDVSGKGAGRGQALALHYHTKFLFRVFRGHNVRVAVHGRAIKLS